MAGLKLHVGRPAVREKLFRSFLLVCTALLPLSLFQAMHLHGLLAETEQRLFSATTSHPHFQSRERMLEITDNNRDLVYIPSAELVFMTMAKGGTTSTWNWLYAGLTGRERFNNSACVTYVQDVNSHCWGGLAKYVYTLDEDEQWRVLTGGDTLRVAIQRDPFERLVSSFKSKFTCEAEKFKTDLRNRETMVPALLRQAGLPPNPKGCLTIGEFAEALDNARRKAGMEGHRLKDIRRMDVHIRPQDFFFDEIDYDIVLDVADLANVSLLAPVVERLKYKDRVRDGIVHRHASGGGESLWMSEKSAKQIYRFAKESKLGEVKYYKPREGRM